MFQLDVMSRTPVYEQIIQQFEQFIMTDILKSGDKLDSVRSLSMQLHINPNTIQKAYAELDHRGLMCSVPGKGCFVSPQAKDIITRDHRGELSNLLALMEKLRQAGVTRQEMLDCVAQVYDGEEKL